MVYSSNKNGDGIGMVYGIGFTTCIPKKIEKVKLITILGLDVPFYLLGAYFLPTILGIFYW